MERILIVEDEDPIRELIRLHLTMAGYEPLEAANGIEALEIIGNSKLDLVLLDIMLPGIDGYSLLPEITKRDISVIMLTAKDALIDKVQGFELGADDYLTKPFQAVELLARIKAVLRRSKKTISCLYYDDITLYLDQHQVFKNNLEIDLTFKEFELLRLLIENKGLVMSREKLLQLVWDYDYEGNTRTVDMHIKRLREKLATDKITTVYKVGYRLEA